METLPDLGPDLSTVAALIGDPTRSALLIQLFDGAARTAGELALGAGISPQVASNQLARLRNGGLLTLEVQGRHRYYRLSGREVAQALEVLSALTLAQPLPSPRASRVPLELRFARTCYDHLAGELGVALTDALLERDILREDARDFYLTPVGETWFADLEVDLGAVWRSRRVFARRCLDWSERRPHLGGALGAALLERLRERGWLVSAGQPRTLRLTVAGAAGLEHELGLRFSRGGETH